MAYIDNNNPSSGKGKDPIREQDEELEQLLAQFGKKDGDPKSKKPSEKALDDTAPTAPKPEEYPVKPPKPAEDFPEPDPEPPKKRGKALKTTLVIILILGVVAAVAWGVHHILSSKLSVHIDTNSPKVETVSFTDSELGEVQVKKVEGASLNTYDTDSLVKNENGYYEYLVDGKVVSESGIDLAEYQGEVDFNAVKNAGVDFVILRIGGRYYSEEGTLYADGMFDTYYEQAKAAGLKVGAYFFSQAANVEEAKEEAAYVLAKLNGRKLDYPVAFDWEIIDDDEARTDNVPNSTITAMAEAFCDTIREADYQAIVYSSTSLMLESYDFETMKDYDFWLADYREIPNMYYDFTMWQYATDGEVAGVNGTVDLNICLKPY